MDCPRPDLCDEAQTCVGRCRPGSIFYRDPTMTEKPNLTELAQDLASASARLAELEQAESFARNATTSQRNAVNDLQKKFDSAVVAVRNAAGNGTDWGQRRRSGQNMAAE